MNIVKINELIIKKAKEYNREKIYSIDEFFEVDIEYFGMDLKIKILDINSNEVIKTFDSCFDAFNYLEFHNDKQVKVSVEESPLLYLEDISEYIYFILNDNQKMASEIIKFMFLEFIDSYNNVKIEDEDLIEMLEFVEKNKTSNIANRFFRDGEFALNVLTTYCGEIIKNAKTLSQSKNIEIQNTYTYNLNDYYRNKFLEIYEDFDMNLSEETNCLELFVDYFKEEFFSLKINNNFIYDYYFPSLKDEIIFKNYMKYLMLFDYWGELNLLKDKGIINKNEEVYLDIINNNDIIGIIILFEYDSEFRKSVIDCFINNQTYLLEENEKVQVNNNIDKKFQPITTIEKVLKRDGTYQFNFKQ